VNRVELERGVAIPPRQTRGPVYPWKRMEVGDSFWVANTSGGLCAAGHRVTGHLYTQRRMPGPDGTEGLRIWRVK